MAYQKVAFYRGIEVYNESGKAVMVGYNRRFSPLTQEMTKMMLPNQMKAINIRVNAGIVPADHWVHDPEFGAVRILPSSEQNKLNYRAFFPEDTVLIP